MTLEAKHGNRRFTIEHDENVGFYLYVFDGERCTHDYLQDALDLAKEFALDEFDVPYDAWSEAARII